MQIKRLSLCILIASGLSGCGIFGPSYTQPQVGEADGWVSQDNLSTLDTSANLPDTAWWKSFNDPVLDGLMEYALANNPSIQQAIGNILLAKGELQQVAMGWVPTVDLGIGYGQTGTFGGAAQSANAGAATVGGNTGYQVGVIPGYTNLNILQQIRNQQAYAANLSAMRYAKDSTRLTILSQVATSYFTLLASEYQLKLQQQLVADTKQRLDIGQVQYQNGFTSLLTIQSYAQDYENTKAQVPLIEQTIVSTQNALRVLMNKNPGAITAGMSFADVKTDGIIPGNLPSQVLRNRPDIMQAESELIQANANIGVATSRFFPSITLTTPVGTAASQLNQLFSAGNDFWKVAVQAGIPALDLSILGKIKAAKGAYYTAYYKYLDVVRNAFAQVDTDLATHEKSTQSYNAQQQAFMSSKNAYAIDYSKYTAGAESLIGTLTYKIDMEKADISLAKAKLNQLQSIVNLYQSLAGGYNFKNTEAPKKFGDGHDA